MRIQFITLDQGHHLWEIPASELPIDIGRDPAARIRLDDESVRDFHCVVRKTDAAVWVHSVQGTMLNGRHVQLARLRHGDRLTVGTTRFLIVFFTHWAGPPRPGEAIEAGRSTAVAGREDRITGSFLREKFGCSSFIGPI